MSAPLEHERQTQEERLAAFAPQLEALAQDQGLVYYPVDFELVPSSFVMEIAVYGLPVRMPHWSFGVRYIYQYIQHRMGYSKVFEVVFPGNLNQAYLVRDNSLAENTLVTAHVLGHADFSRNNSLFRRMQQQLGDRIVEQAAQRAQRIHEAIENHGEERVERVLDAALALEQCVNLSYPIYRKNYSEETSENGSADNDSARPESAAEQFHHRFRQLPGESSPEQDSEDEKTHNKFPPHRESDLLWFIARYGPEMEPWERDIFLAVREESFYFYPVFACQIMNEGWASYWHARLLREADFLPHDLYIDAIRTHSDVVRPYAGKNKLSPQVNPYHLGFGMWEKIVEEQGLEAAFRIRAEEDDFSFVRNYLDEDLAEEMKLFYYTRHKTPAGIASYHVEKPDINKLREAIIAPKFNFGGPRIFVDSVELDGTLMLIHDWETDGRGLDLHRAEKVLEYIKRIWRRRVQLATVDDHDREKILTVE